jgi:hypothetical protein
MPLKEGLLAFTGKTLDQVLAAGLGAHTEYLERDHLSSQDRMRHPPVHFGFPTQLRIQGDEDPLFSQSQTPPGLSHITTHRALPSRVTMLPAQPPIDAHRRMTLLFGPPFVPFQPPVDDRKIRPQYRIGLPITGPVAPVFPSQRPLDRVLRVPRIPCDLLDPLAVNPMCDANVLVLVHCQHTPFCLPAGDVPMHHITSRERFCGGSILG